MRYDVLDTETGNLYGRFQTEEAALSFVRELIAANGAGILESVALGGRDEAGDILPMATGEVLEQRVLAEMTDRLPVARRS
jgi:hypothetical protein